MKPFEIALIGNQNAGKTTLFNALTGSNQHVGNFPGVTVEKKEGYLISNHDMTIVDLPGIYSLSPYTAEEIVTRDYLLKEKPVGIINIIDATNLERNLYLTLQLIELNMPTVLALNMMDEVRANGHCIDVEGLSKALGIPIVPIAASKKEGVEDLIAVVETTVKNKTLPRKMDFCRGAVHKAIHSVAHIVEENAIAAKIPVRFAATKLVEGDKPATAILSMEEEDMAIIESIVAEMEHTLGTDREAALADMRYEFIENLCENYVKREGVCKGHERSVRIDRFLTHRIFAIPTFLCIMAVIFWFTFSAIGPICNDLMQSLVNVIAAKAAYFLEAANVNRVLTSMIIDGAFAGVGAILSFLPTIIILFFFLSLLEDSGYMARVAFVFDSLFRKVGLSGKSFVPMLIGFGCSVPAIMATRTLGSDRERKMTILLTPFMSCSAKLPIYAVFTMAFFQRHQGLVMIALYVLGIVVAVAAAFLLKNTKFKGRPMPFLMELPPYRLPDFKTVMRDLWSKTKDFLTRAFTIIFLASLVVWLLQSFDFRFNLVSDSSESILAVFGKLLAPVFTPLGFGDWRAATALVTGLMSKETVISTFAILLGAGDSTGVASLLSTLFTPLSAFSFLVFTLLYMPCVATFAVTRRELGGTSKALLASLFQTSVAWFVALLFYQIGGLVVGL